MAQQDSGGLLGGADPTEIFAPAQPSVFADVNAAKPAYPKHPITTIFHLVFKLAAILTYVFGGIVADNIVVTWVFVVIFVGSSAVSLRFSLSQWKLLTHWLLACSNPHSCRFLGYKERHWQTYGRLEMVQ